MKKIFLSFLIFLSLSYAKDLDILSIASNGSLSDKTSHKLNDDELKQVVGGFYILNTNKPYFTDSVINNYGQKFGFTAYYELGYSDNFEKSLIDNANFRFNDKVVIKAHYNFKTGKSDIQLVGFNKYTKQIRRVGHNSLINNLIPQVQGLLNKHKDSLFDPYNRF